MYLLVRKSDMIVNGVIGLSNLDDVNHVIVVDLN